MNALGIALLWCVVQVTLLGLLCSILYLIVRRLRPAAGAPVALTGLLTVVFLSLVAIAPWPRWPMFRPASPRAAETCEDAAESIPRLRQGSSTADSLKSAPPGEGPAVSGPGAFNAALWWRALLGELSQPPQVVMETGWRWPALLAAFFLAGAAAGAAWVLLGMLAVRRQRKHSRPAEDQAVLELVDTLRAELSCRRGIEVRQSDDLTTAATIGWRRPVILLPSEWTGWTTQQRRAVLAHEIAHVRRNDFLAVLCGQLGLVFHFYHPLLHWLMSRLRLEQELAADAAAASVTGGQNRYLMTLAELALRQDNQRIVWPARSFLPTRNMFLRRIAMLRNARLRFERRSPIARALAVGTVLACGLLIAGLRGPAIQPVVLALESQTAVAGNPSDSGAKRLDGIDLTYVPETAIGFFAYRPAAVLRVPELSEYRVIEGPANDTRLAEETEQTTIVLLSLDAGGGTPGESVMIWQMTHPNSFDRDFAILGKTAKSEYRGKTYFIEPVRGPRGADNKTGSRSRSPALLRLNDRTLVQADTEDAMHKFIDATFGLPRFLDRDRWRAFEKDHAIAAIDTSKLAPLLKTALTGPGDQSPFLSMFSPLWVDTSWGIGGLYVGRELRAHASVVTARPEQAERVAKTVMAGATVLANMALANMANEAIAAAKPEDAFSEPHWGRSQLRIASALLTTIHTQTEGNIVSAEGSISKEIARMMLPPVAEVRKAATRLQAVNNLSQIALAMHRYHDTYRCFPPSVLYGPDGKTPYSWRVALLPFLNQEALYKQYRFDEPWDGPNNRRLAETRVPVFQCPKETPRSANASYFALVGSGTAFEKKDRRSSRALSAMPGMGGIRSAMGGSSSGAGLAGLAVATDGVSFMEITDGTSNTLMVVEAKRDIPWSKPEDIPYDPKKPISELGGCFEGGFHAAMCDGNVYFFPKGFSQETLRTLITRAGGEPIDWHSLEKILGAGPAWLRQKPQDLPSPPADKRSTAPARKKSASQR